MNDSTPRAPILIERPELQEGRWRFAWSLVTLLAWSLWFYLWLPLISLVAWAAGIQLFRRHILDPNAETYLRSLALYGSVALGLAVVLVSWSLYNLRRFGGLDRRKATPAVAPAQLCEDFGIEMTLLAKLHGARVATLHLGEEGRLERVEAGEMTREREVSA